MYASTELQDDKEVAMAAVANYGTAIAHASARLQADAELASEAVKQNGDAFQYVAKELKADKRLAIAAVRNTCYALKFAAAKLKGDPEVVLEAVAQNPRSFKLATKKMREGGLRAFLLERLQAHEAFQVFLLASLAPTPSSSSVLQSSNDNAGSSAARPRTDHGPTGLTPALLNEQGPNFAILLKRSIAVFAGVPLGEEWVTVQRAHRSLRDGNW
mmetsp:Transcript_11228/g.26368  ORF Transcript_11228/g.26368 Transcript_11228/m.26368 type:complete len:215 (+) Transcript_11228:376-1020(+)